MSEELKQKALKVILLSQLLTECIEDLHGTSFYRKDTKYFGNRLVRSLEPTTSQFNRVYDESPEITNNAVVNIENLIEKLAKCDVHKFIMINQIEEHYNTRKDEWNDLINITFKKLDT